MNISDMRKFIAEHPKYKNSPTWFARCLTMPDAQVCAIYHKFRNEGFNYKKIDRDIRKTKKENEKYHQMNMFEYMQMKEASEAEDQEWGTMEERTNSDIYKFFLEKAPAEDVKAFCEINGYYLVIFDGGHMSLKREKQE